MENRVPSGAFKLCEQMELLEFPDKFLIRSLDSPDQAFSIGRSDGSIDTQIGDSCFGGPSKVSKIYGVVGTIQLLEGTFALIITSRREAGTYLGFPVFLVTSMKFLSCNETLKLSTSQEKKDKSYFMTLLRTVESTPGLYYSYGVDLTLNLQRTFKLTEESARKPLWKRADPRFVWNRNLLEELIECKLDPFIIPLVQGSFQTVQFTLKDAPASITLISRRCTRRLGTRMWRRGANLEGDAANFIETEQLLEIRGSIPLLWEQIVDLSYKPQLKIINHEDTPKVVERHFHDLTQRYGEVMVVDLTDEHGDEGQLSMAFAAEVQKLPHVRYISFDFHHHCGNSNLDNLQLLYDQISEDFKKQGYCFIDSEGEILAEQKGIFRVNCIDCLDRTNVTQSYLARESLNSQLRKIGALSFTECISKFNEIYEKFKTLWVEHGDEISLEYSGTHAMKSDFLRFGRQTLPGLIKDGMTGLSRYYLNNFHDGIRQDAMDLISGHYTVNGNNPSPLHLNRFESFSYLPVASVLLVGGLTLTSFTLNQGGRNAQHLVSSVLWAGLTAGVVAVVKANGRQFCSRPRLCGLL
ncbi:phosphoinositide phosphatase SAC8-like isoform X2 [Macadamia integrifolia]|uniref:phosphoinositide phosphatase SAC8-like isoform X2 n=1 Tax=Macadamia integrifolia TaxID=60698 RepID=UPI001C4E51BB|nr:phosphoinositide phosphatase SAC8-like isoform X2 [Macadamia integrifolia]